MTGCHVSYWHGLTFVESSDNPESCSSSPCSSILDSILPHDDILRQIEDPLLLENMQYSKVHLRKFPWVFCLSYWNTCLTEDDIGGCRH